MKETISALLSMVLLSIFNRNRKR